MTLHVPFMTRMTRCMLTTELRFMAILSRHVLHIGGGTVDLTHISAPHEQCIAYKRFLVRSIVDAHWA